MFETKNVLLGLGGNEAGPWGEPASTILRALAELGNCGVTIERVSQFIATAPVGPVAQASYVNAAAAARTSVGPEALLVLAKRLESAAGRRSGPRWGPRPLDIDILDFGGQVMGWQTVHDPMQPAHLVLPHPELHKRAFVLEPLAEIAPDWRHPVFCGTARQMLDALPDRV